MELSIKLEPHNFEESESLSCGFVDTATSYQNPAACGTNSKGNIQAKVHSGNKRKFAVLRDEDGFDNHEINELNANTKRLLLRTFKQEGCSKETFNKFVSINLCNPQLASDYLNDCAKDAEDFVYQECDSLSFNNVTEWLKYLKSTGAPKDCNYELAITLNAIANNEDHPEPKLMDGVDLKAVYRFLSYSLMGLPQEQLDPASAKFLSNEFQNLIDGANTDGADTEVRNMKRKIEECMDNNCGGKIKSESLSLDPFNIAEFE